MTEIIKWADGNGWTIKLTGDEALILKSTLVSTLEEQGKDADEIIVDMGREQGCLRWSD